MPTTTPLTDAINALTTYANETTGAGDTTLSEAVATLVAGYGQGGGDGASLEYIKTVTLDSDVNVLQLDISDLTSEYNVIIIQGTMTFSAQDWFYPNYWVGNTRKTMTGYTNKVTTYSGTWSLINSTSNGKIVVAPPNAAFFVTDNVTALGGHCYTSSVNVIAGTQFNYYGIKQSGFSIEDYLDKRITGSAVWTESDNVKLTGISLQGQIGITSLSFPNVNSLASVASGGFSNMTGLITFYAPKAQRQPGSLLNGCSSLVNVNLDSLTDTGNLLLSYCTSLTTVVLPSVQNIYSQTVRGCTNLEVLDVLASNGFTNQNNMNGCTKLNKLIIRKNGVATLSNVNNFTGTPFASGGTGGEIYVPSAQISSYESATNWSTLNGYGTVTWKAIEDSYYETHYADGRTIE